MDVCALLMNALYERVMAQIAQYAGERVPEPVAVLARDLLAPLPEDYLLLLAGNEDYYVHEVSAGATRMLEPHWPGIVIQGGANARGLLQYTVFFEPPIDAQWAGHQD